MSLFDKISSDIMASMKARDKVRTETLRNIKKVFIEAKTAPGAENEFDDNKALKIIAKLAKQGHDSAEQFLQAGRQDLANAELAQVKIIEEYLPKALTPEELEQEIKQIIEEVGATSLKDMGKIMGIASQKFVGRADGQTISTIVKKLLA